MNGIDRSNINKKVLQQVVKLRKPKLLTMAVVSSLATMAATSTQATDLEIYQAASSGKPTVTLMLDISGSMDIIDLGGTRRVEDETTTYPFKKYYRKSVHHSGVKKYRRIDDLKMGVIDLINSPELLDNIYIGFGVYPAPTSSGPVNAGSLVVPTKLLTEDHKKLILNKVSALDANGWTPASQAYAEVGAYMMGTNTTGTSSSDYHSGFGYSAVPKENGHYIAPKSSSCAGEAIYFLTDGSPNASSTTIAKNLMDKALTPNSGSAKLSTNCSKYHHYKPTYFKSEEWDKSGWSCMLDFVDQLLDERNPKGSQIKTATVGFGSSYAGLKSATKLADCDIAYGDVKLLCQLGIRGQGGFYYAENSSDIVNSIKSLTAKLNEDITPVSTGTISVPLDSLGSFTSRKFAYLPILEPVPGQTALWNGNLKKYNVKNATLKGGNGNFVFKDALGQFASDTYDLWNTNKTSDDAKPQVGGTYQRVFENTGQTRHLFVNSTGSLTNLKVDEVSRKPMNFDKLSTQYDNTHKLTLLHFMGYAEPATTNVKDGSALKVTKNKDLKNIGGVLHSVPQLITTEVELKNNGQFDNSTRKDYILYGSMDGALHMVNDKTGEETFTFVPKQILDLQPDAIKGTGTTANGTYPYGVDAPWETYTSYDIKKGVSSSPSVYKAGQSLAMGGLRMGGSTYYALDITNVNKPELVFSVGSNYSNRLQDATLPEEGIKNDITGTDQERQAYARMGQTWAKPAIGYVKSGGKKVMVNFLPGGYDMCYEDPEFKLNTPSVDAKCNNKANAQGNAMYMVQLGEEKTGSSEFDLKKNNGKLLWWASNQGSGSDATSASNSLQYSKQADLKHSIVTQVRTLDRNYDGLTDHIYFSDLGGQVWRVDINNDKDTDNFKIDRVVKVLDVSDQADGDDTPPRFYERPLVTFHNGDYGFEDTKGTKGSYSGVMAVVTVGTGDRSSPVKASRKKPDALYSFIDKDVTRKDLFKKRAPKDAISMRTSEVKAAKLAQLTFTDSDVGSTGGIKAQMQSNAVQGWYMPFTHWLDKDAQTADGKYKIKMFNEPDALANVLILSTYDPDQGNTAAECSAGVIGQTQRDRACLPYGVCLDGDDKPVKTPRIQTSAGVGIADNFITQFNDTSVFTSIKNRCEGADCEPKVICPSGVCPPVDGLQNCTGAMCGPESGVNTDQRINPLQWMEHKL